jgi:hypothetical protein
MAAIGTTLAQGKQGGGGGGQTVKHIGNDPQATRSEQARFVLELLVDIGGRALYRTVEEKSNLRPDQLRDALRYLNQTGYVSFRIRMDRLVLYQVTMLGMDTLDVLQDLDTCQQP